MRKLFLSIFFLIFITHFTYAQPSCHEDSTITWNYNSQSNVWDYSNKEIYSYNLNQIDNTLGQHWFGSAWSDYYQFFYLYDGNGNLIEWLGKTWNGSSWIDSWHNLYTYDGNNNKTSDSTQNWNGSVWVNYETHLYSYDSNNNLLSDWWQNPNLGIRQYLYTYDNNNNQIGILCQSWDNISSIWWNNSKDSSVYDSNNNQILSIGQFWNNNLWVNDAKCMYTYNLNNDVTQQIVQWWLSNQWKNQSKADFTYDLNNNLLNKLIGSWSQNNWDTTDLWVYTYDINNNRISYVIKYGGTYIPFYNVDSVHYYYRCGVGINEIANKINLTIYPNPFSTETTLQTDKFFKNASLTVYNSFGQTVKRINNLTGQTIVFHRDNLPSGLYFIRLTQDNKTFSADKLVITDN